MKDNIRTLYEQAQAFMQGVLTNRMVLNDAVFPHWINKTNSFWYVRETRKGKEFRLVDASAARNTNLFDHQALADALTEYSGQFVNYQDLPIKDAMVSLSPLQIRFQAFGKNWLFKPSGAGLQEIEIDCTEGLSSPDGKKTVFFREYNLWVRDHISAEEQALTRDGTKERYYANPHNLNNLPDHWQWSPDSKFLLARQVDVRNVASRATIQFFPDDGTQQPQLHSVKMAYPGDKITESNRLFIINVTNGCVLAAKYRSLPLSIYGTINGLSVPTMAWWSIDSRRLFFIDVDRGAAVVRVVELDAYTGDTRVLFEERSDTFVKLSNTLLDRPLFLPLPESYELIWFSERTGLGHLYLYDLNTGKLKNTITQGQWLVREVLHYDTERREIILQTAGRNRSISPYYRDICKVNIDTGLMIPIISGDFEYKVYKSHNYLVNARHMFGLNSVDVDGVSPDGQFLVTTRSRVNTTPVSLLIDRNGKEILTLETADTHGLPSDWHWPEPVKLRGADGQTDIYGVMYRPPGFSPDNCYPVIDFSCSPRNLSIVPQGSFVNSDPDFGLAYFSCAALSSLGFIVVAMEGRGTPLRGKEFQDYHYGDVSSTCEPNDRIVGLRQLAKRYPYMDLGRVGITGFDNIASPVYGLLNHPEFYKVAVVFCYTDPLSAICQQSEMYDGISLNNSKTLYPENIINSLEGKLLLIQGMLDPVALSGTFRLVEALQKANKDFDLICMPSKGHDVPTYAIRRSWDYLVAHLQGVQPPKEFHLTTGLDLCMNSIFDNHAEN